MRGTLFDQPFYREINEARWHIAEAVLGDLLEHVPLRTCLDVGAGPGWFTRRLQGLGLEVEGLEGRAENVELFRVRVPDARIRHVDVESEPQTSALGRFDLVFCFGLLYHTENPLRVLRNLRRLTRHVLFLETMVVPGESPYAMLVTENENETQGLTRTSLIPTTSCLVTMLACAGFPWTYEYAGPVDHPDFLDTAARHRRRRIFIASSSEIAVRHTARVHAVATPKYDFAKRPGGRGGQGDRGP
jgi:SAM-dependent methyltransferase